MEWISAGAKPMESEVEGVCGKYLLMIERNDVM